MIKNGMNLTLADELYAVEKTGWRFKRLKPLKISVDKIILKDRIESELIFDNSKNSFDASCGTTEYVVFYNLEDALELYIPLREENLKVKRLAIEKKLEDHKKLEDELEKYRTELIIIKAKKDVRNS